MKRKLQIGDEGRFLIVDHSMKKEKDTDFEGGNVLPFYVYGRVVAGDKLGVTIATWVSPEFEVDENTEWFGIVRGAVKEFVPLVRRKRA